MARSKIGELLVSIFLRSEGLDKGVRKSKSKLKGFKRFAVNTSANINRAFSRIGTGLIVAGLAQATRSLIDFDQKVANLASVTGKTRDQISGLVENAIDFGSRSAFTSSQVVELQTELAKLGNSEDQIIAMTESVGNFALAVNASTAEAAALAGGTLKAFNRSANETEQVVSTLAVATTKSALDFQKLNTALPIVAAAANTSGVSLTRLTALLGVLANRNVDASSAATALRNIFIDLSKKGISYEDAMSKIRNSTDKLNTANELFGKKGAVVATILSESKNAADGLEKSLSNVDGALQKMTDTRLDSLAGRFTKFGSAWDGLTKSVDKGDGILSNAAKSILNLGTNTLTALTALNKGAGLDDYFIIQYGSEADRKKVIDDINAANKAAREGELTGVSSLAYQRIKDFEERKAKQQQREAEDAAKLAAAQEQREKDEKEAEERRKKDEKDRIDRINDLEASLASLSNQYKDTGANFFRNEIEEQLSVLVKLNKEIGTVDSLIKRATSNISVQGIGSTSNFGPRDNSVIGSAGPTQLASASAQNVTIDPEYVTRSAESSKAMVEVTKELASANYDLQESYRSMGQTLQDSLAKGAASYKEFAGSVLDSLQAVLAAQIRVFVGNALTSLLGKTGFLGLVAAPAIAGLAEGLFNTTINSLKAPDIPALANGGVINKPTVALLGEYSGAKSNPEIAAPESKLRNIFSAELRKNGGGTTHLQTTIMAGQIYASNKRAEYTVGRTG